MNLRMVVGVVALAVASAPAYCKPKPVQDCKVSFLVVYLDRLNNTNLGIPPKNLNDIQKKTSAFGDVCYSTAKTADLVFFIHTTPAIYHGTHVYTNTSTSAAAANSSDGSAAAAAASTTSTTAVPYSVDYSVFILDIEKQQPDGSFQIVRTLDQKGLYNTIYGIGFGKGTHPIASVIEAGAKWLHENSLGQ